MLSVLLIGPEDTLVRDWKAKTADLVGLYIRHQIGRYPSAGELLGLLDEYTPDALVINLADYTQVSRSIGRLSMERPQLPIIGLHTECDQGMLLDLMQLGVRELWFPPLNVEQMQKAVSRLIQQKNTAAALPGPTGEVVAFLPARGGCGTTTIAVNTAAALERLRGPVLLADFDFHNSLIAFWLKLQPRHGFQEALERAHWLDATLWKGMVQSVGKLDILTAPQTAAPIVFTSSETSAVVDFACRTYERVLVDLPEAIYSSCWEVLERAKYVMIVVTPEMSSLYLARRKISQLVNHGIPKLNIRVLLNRAAKFDIQSSEVEQFLTLPVMASFGNQYRTVTSAVTDGKFVPETSKLGVQFARFAESLIGGPERGEKQENKKTSINKLRQIFSPA